jgi:hypothetical protein
MLSLSHKYEFMSPNFGKNSGNDDELDGEAYDYQRLIAHLTGKKKKLAVAVEYI